LNFAGQVVAPGWAFCRRLIDATCKVVNKSIVSFEVDKLSNITVIPLYCAKNEIQTLKSSFMAFETLIL
jgi:hypothetical protein